jgi:AraC-like DNA-binding protein
VVGRDPLTRRSDRQRAPQRRGGICSPRSAPPSPSRVVSIFPDKLTRPRGTRRLSGGGLYASRCACPGAGVRESRRLHPDDQLTAERRIDAIYNADMKSPAWRNRRTFLRLCRARDLLSDLRSSNVSIAEAAREASLSSFHFIRRFEAAFGETPHQFRTRERLTAAQRLLARGRSVTDVCLDVGFSSLGSFSTLFARRVGISPAEYQRSLRRSVYVPDWTPHPPTCLLLMGGPDAIAVPAAAGDLILMHSLLLHAVPAAHVGTQPRFLLSTSVQEPYW